MAMYICHWGAVSQPTTGGKQISLARCRWDLSVTADGGSLELEILPGPGSTRTRDAKEEGTAHLLLTDQRCSGSKDTCACNFEKCCQIDLAKEGIPIYTPSPPPQCLGMSISPHGFYTAYYQMFLSASISKMKVASQYHFNLHFSY